MAVSKRTRFEVLRRDNFTCRYCRSNEGQLTVDHVVPVALGGTDAPDNLVACCKDCNAGKSSTSPDAETVANVADDAARWSEAMKRAAETLAAEKKALASQVDHWEHAIWQSWNGPGDEPLPLPDDWRDGIAGKLKAGLSMDDLRDAVDIAMNKRGIKNGNCFRYFMGVCNRKLADRAALARELLDREAQNDG